MNKLSSRAEPGLESACPVKRTLFNIVWNCVSTTIICAWVSVHPNVPPSGYWKGLCRRVEMMFWTIVAPELILAWAVRQWFAAWEIRDAVNGNEGGLLTGLERTIKGLFRRGTPPVTSRWTMVHGHFLAMGGITTVDPLLEDNDHADPHRPVFTIERYRDAIKNEKRETLNRKLRNISEADIRDRSKGDLLSKLIAVSQTTWFMLQCIARGQQKLALTELELVTLALASLNAITYAFWWHKPLGVQEPIRIYFGTAATSDQNVDEHSDSREPEISASYILSAAGEFLTMAISESFANAYSDGCVMLTFFFPFALFVLISFFLLLPFPLGIVFLLRILKTKPVTEEPLGNLRGLIAARIVLALRHLRYKFTSSIALISEEWLRKLIDRDDEYGSGFFIGWLLVLPTLFVFLLVTTIILLPFFALLFLVSFIFTAVFGIITSNTVTPNSTHVQAFYAPRTKSDKYSRMVVFAVFGVIFGGLHCIGWNFTYPTAFEQQVWRVSSSAITVIPLLVAPIDYLLENFKLDRGLLKVVHLTLDLIMTILLFIYVPARLSLIALALALLRQQPQSAFLGVDWNQYIPHIF